MGIRIPNFEPLFFSMKKILFALFFLAVTPVFAQQNAGEALLKYLPAYDTTWNLEAKTELANKFDLIARKWPDSWAANYYAAYAKAQLSYAQPDTKTKDALIDEAENYANTAATLIGREWDELYVLQASIASARLSADPQARWQKYGKMFDQNLDKAKAMNPENPRIYLLRGTSKLYTPKMFGGGKKAALPYFEKAAPLFAKEEKTNPEKPFWGWEANGFMLRQATGEDKE